MLFNSFEFIVLFLPITLIGFFALGRMGWNRLGLAWLVAASLFFYGWFRIDYVPLLVGSVLVNYWLGLRLMRQPSRWLLALGITFNLGLLGYFKYTAFLLDTLNLAFGTGFALPKLLLPLAISFFTFQQIAYLVDAHDGRVRSHDLVSYALFVCFFPQLIAGPIVHHRDMLPQFERLETFRPRLENLGIGLTIFAIGLFKKVMIADGLAPYASKAFAAAGAGGELTIVEAWAGALAFTLQIYFDFSGYSDMAIGLARLFGIRLPINFDAPYKAASIIGFWERWHMTLTRFLTAHVYNPVSLYLTRRRMRAGLPLHRASATTPGAFVTLLAVPTLLTMTLAGVWHGAGWQFVLFGVMHGVFLVVNYLWRVVRHAAGFPARPGGGPLLGLGVLLTFTRVTIAMVMFRANSVTEALVFYEAMAGLNGVVIPIHFAVGPVREIAALLPFEVAFVASDIVSTRMVLSLAVVLLAAWTLPTTQQWLAGFGIGLDPRQDAQRAREMAASLWGRLGWRPAPVYGVLAGALFGLTLMQAFAETPSEFLYFNF